MNQETICKHDIKIQEKRIFSNGTKHIQEKCKTCGKHIKFVPQGEPKLFIGKYKGLTILKVAQHDSEYLRWLYNATSSSNLRRKIADVLKK